MEREVTNIHLIRPDVAVVTVKAIMTLEPGQKAFPVLDVDVMVKQDGKWRIASQHNLGLWLPGTIPTPQKK